MYFSVFCHKEAGLHLSEINFVDKAIYTLENILMDYLSLLSSLICSKRDLWMTAWGKKSYWVPKYVNTFFFLLHILIYM